MIANTCWRVPLALLLVLCGLHQPVMAGSVQDCLQLYYMKSYQQALPWCQQAAAAGDDQAQYVLAMMYLEANGVHENKKRAVRWFQAAASQGHAAARFKLNSMNSADAAVTRQPLWRQRLGSHDGSENTYSTAALSMEHGNGAVLSSDVRPAIVRHRWQHEGLNSAETAELSKEMANDMAEVMPHQTESSVFRGYLASAKQGGVHEQLMLGLMYHEGRGVRKSDRKAVYFLEKAAFQGDVKAQLSLALLLYEGRGVKKNVAQAKDWFSSAAEQGLADAQYSLGLVYAMSRRYKDDARAVLWWRKAAEQKHAQAEHNLAVMYLNGTGVKRDRAQAVYWFQQEAKHGDPVVQFNLGQLYSEGKWLDNNGELAANWFYRAGANHLALGQKSDAMKSADKIKQLRSKYQLNVPNEFLADVLTRKIQESEK